MINKPWSGNIKCVRTGTHLGQLKIALDGAATFTPHEKGSEKHVKLNGWNSGTGKFGDTNVSIQDGKTTYTAFNGTVSQDDTGKNVGSGQLLSGGSTDATWSSDDNRP